MHREREVKPNNKGTMVDAIILIASFIVMLMVAIGIVIAIGYAALFFICATIGGILTLSDKCKTLK